MDASTVASSFTTTTDGGASTSQSHANTTSDQTVSTTIHPDGSRTTETITRTRHPDGSITEEIVTSTVPPVAAAGAVPVPLPPHLPEAGGIGVVPNPPGLLVPTPMPDVKEDPASMQRMQQYHAQQQQQASASLAVPVASPDAQVEDAKPTGSGAAATAASGDGGGCSRRNKQLGLAALILLFLVGAAVGLAVGLSGGGDDEEEQTDRSTGGGDGNNNNGNNGLCLPLDETDPNSISLCFEYECIDPGCDCELRFELDGIDIGSCDRCTVCDASNDDRAASYDCTNLLGDDAEGANVECNDSPVAAPSNLSPTRKPTNRPSKRPTNRPSTRPSNKPTPSPVPEVTVEGPEDTEHLTYACADDYCYFESQNGCCDRFASSGNVNNGWCNENTNDVEHGESWCPSGWGCLPDGVGENPFDVPSSGFTCCCPDDMYMDCDTRKCYYLSTSLTDGVPLTGQSASKDDVLLYTLDVSPGDRVRCEIEGGNGDADLYIRFGLAPVIVPTSSTNACSVPVNSPSSNEACTVVAGSGDTTLIAAVHAWSAYSYLSITCGLTTPDPTRKPTSSPIPEVSLAGPVETPHLTYACTGGDCYLESHNGCCDRFASSGNVNNGWCNEKTYDVAHGAIGCASSWRCNSDGVGEEPWDASLTCCCPSGMYFDCDTRRCYFFSLTSGVSLTGQSASKDDVQQFTMEVSMGDKVTCEISGPSGDADLYARFGDEPVITPASSINNCSVPTNSPSANEICVVTADSDDTLLFVAIHAWSAYSSLTVLCTIEEPIALTDGVEVSGQSANKDDVQLYTLDVDTGDEVTCEISGSNGDADLFLRFGAVPVVVPGSTVNSCSVPENSPTSTEVCVVTAPSDTTLFVAVHAFSSYSSLTIACEIAGVSPLPSVSPTAQPSSEPTADLAGGSPTVSPGAKPSMPPTDKNDGEVSGGTLPSPSSQPSEFPAAETGTVATPSSPNDEVETGTPATPPAPNDETETGNGPSFQDEDSDGLADSSNSDPNNPDADSDGIIDGNDPGYQDEDSDGLVDSPHSDHNNPDADSDGIVDGNDPSFQDEDSDGLADSSHSDPNNPDADSDGIINGNDTSNQDEDSDGLADSPHSDHNNPDADSDGTATGATPSEPGAEVIYLNDDAGVSVSVGPRSNPNGQFMNVPLDQSLSNIIDLDAATDSEEHNQQSHVWWEPSPLELIFDLGAVYELQSIHFWNYHGETWDVDGIDFEFLDANNNTVGSLSVTPAAGVSNGELVTAETFNLEDTPTTAKYVTALLTASNGNLDFNNIGFSALVP